ncbi:hypothetical protein GPECTOR_39g506 [Gonium pectorale]|uniref:Uncharacterized protein n=1 Tax=Gonium pectorale TaxID=33097 RepID=A0A150GAZ5_GONPE|nr:hypothetical protein GPECTOR_39g506 [Gonium pectorale]|eukprot:KXZ47012.1 hypothetical protein GPECTOR_39g506 [Gonium pectorale]
MGLWISKLWSLFGDQEARILVLGLDNAGKTTILYRLQAIIYVVDSTDTDRIGVSRDEFKALLDEEELRDSLILVFANKQDLPNALTDAQIAEGLGLYDIKNRDWAIFKTSAVKGEGLFEGLDWLANMLKTRRK